MSDRIGLNEIASPANVRSYVAEFFSFMLFVLMATGSIIAVSAIGGGPPFDAAGIAFISISHGLAISVMLFAFDKMGSSHLNPVVTLAFIVLGKVKIAPGAIIMLAHFIAACCATALLYAMVNDDIGNMSNFGAHGVNTAVVGGDGGAFLVEMVLTAALLAVVIGSIVAKRNWGVSAPIAIGMAVMLIHFVAIPMTGASVNPARTFGPALISNAFDSFWVYMLAPAVGAVLAAVLYHHFFRVGMDDEPEDA